MLTTTDKIDIEYLTDKTLSTLGLGEEEKRHYVKTRNGVVQTFEHNDGTRGYMVIGPSDDYQDLFAEKIKTHQTNERVVREYTHHGYKIAGFFWRRQ